jgi:hypothetical protein
MVYKGAFSPFCASTPRPHPRARIPGPFDPIVLTSGLLQIVSRFDGTVCLVRGKQMGQAYPLSPDSSTEPGPTISPLVNAKEDET